VCMVLVGQLNLVISESSDGNEFHLVRVYSNAVECQDFTVPGGHVMTSKTADSAPHDAELQAVSLHYLVRHGDSSTAQLIRTIESHYNDDDNWSMTPEQLELYHEAIKEREQELLAAADVILCTCGVSGEARITSSTNIQQVSAIHSTGGARNWSFEAVM